MITVTRNRCSVENEPDIGLACQLDLSLKGKTKRQEKESKDRLNAVRSYALSQQKQNKRLAGHDST